MGPAHAKEETREAWYGVQDPRKRKQIQDRLAQRARRKRLAEESKKDRTLVVCSGHSKRFRPIAPSDCSDTGTSDTSPPNATSSTSTPSQAASTSTSSPPATLPLDIPGRSPLAPAATSSPSPHDQQLLLKLTRPPSSPPPPSHPTLPTDHHFLIKPNRSAFIAFAEIGQRMGISWVCVGLVRSWRQPPDLPENLQPTPLQLTTPHPVWIDRLPFPRMRDNVILLADTIDMAQFYVDLTLNESFEVKEGLPSHDPAAYRIVPEFKAKWGYLFH